jgi:Cdc25 family phosphatase
MIRMSLYTISDLPRMSREKLATLVRSKSSSLAVIDVRDSDYIGGHIVNGINAPTHTHDYRMPELVRTLKDKEIVVFHCALSQQRGPSSALRYLREKDRLQSLSTKATDNARAHASAEGVKADTTADGAGVVKNGQTVYVLEGGFVKWQEV